MRLEACEPEIANPNIKANYKLRTETNCRLTGVKR